MLDMEITKRIVYIAISIIAIGIFFKRKYEVSYNKQLKIFQKLGFNFNPGTSEEDLDRWESKAEFESSPFSLMYFTLGSTIEREPWTALTNKAISIHLESAEMSGVYSEILKDLKRISNGELNFNNIQDEIDFENQKANVSFSINGDYYNWDLRFNTDWLDLNLFSKIQDLVKKYKNKGSLTLYVFQETDIVIGYYSKEELKQIKKLTKLNISEVYTTEQLQALQQ